MQNHTDVLVIGGGAIGICVAYYLSQNGFNVTVLEKSAIASGCSDKNAGLIVPSHVIPLAAPGMIAKGLKWMLNPGSPFYVKPRLDLDLISWLWKFSRACRNQQMRKSIPVLHELLQASYALFDELSNSCNDFGLTQKGLLMLYKNHRALQADLRDTELARDVGLEVSILNNEQIHDLEPAIRISAKGGIYYHQDAHLDPTLFTHTLTEYLQQNSVNICVSTEVLGFELANGMIKRIRTSHGDFSGDEIVLAGGAWSPAILKNLRIRLPVQAGKGYSVTVNNPQQKPRVPFILAEVKVAVTPLKDRLRFAGTLELSGLDLSINHRRVNAILNAISEYLPDISLAEVQPGEVWSGLRPCTPDGLPFIGRFPTIKNLIAATGHAMLGITLAPITGKLVTEIVQEKTPAIALSTFSVDRFD